MDPEFVGPILAHAGLSGAFALGTLIVGILSIMRLRSRKDPARAGFLWLRLAIGSALIFFLFNMVFDILTYLILGYILYIASDLESQLLLLSLSTVAGTFVQLTEVLLVITFVDIGNGFLYALEKKPLPWLKTARLGAMFFAAVFFIITVVSVALGYVRTARYYRAYDSYSSSYSYWDDDSENLQEAIDGMNEMSRLNIAYSILAFVVSLFILIHASIVRQKYRGIQPSANSVTLYLVAAVLYFVRMTWGMIIRCLLMFGQIYELQYVEINYPLDMVLNLIVLFIVLTLLFSVGYRRQNGLWTILQPWMNGVPPAMVRGQPQVYYSGQPGMYQQPYPPPNTVMYAPQQPQSGWPQQPQQPTAAYYPSGVPQEVQGVQSPIIPGPNPVNYPREGHGMQQQQPYEMKP